jgi:hypothetical protein
VIRVAEIRPEWAMVGWQDGGWHWLLASRDLESATLDWVRRGYDFTSWETFLRPDAFRPAWHVDIVGAGGSMVLIKTHTYAECLADLLFNHGWRADSEPLALPTHDPIRGHLAAIRAEKMLEAEVVDEP